MYHDIRVWENIMFGPEPDRPKNQVKKNNDYTEDLQEWTDLTVPVLVRMA